MTQPIRPSEVTDWLRCPQLHQYKHTEGWEPPASTWSPERLIGTALHAGVAEYWRERLPGITLALTASPDFSTSVALQQGWPSDAPQEFSQEGTEAHALKVLDAVLKWIGRELPDAEPILVEHTLRADGCTPDLVTREPIGLVVTDWKYHHSVPSDRIHYRLEGLDRTHQFQDYIWQVGEYLKEPVRLFRKVAMIGGPRITVRAGEFMPTPEGTAQWLRGAREIWQQMAEMKAGTRVVYQRSETGCKPFGDKWPCSMWESCWTCHGDREKMMQFYTRTASAGGARA